MVILEFRFPIPVNFTGKIIFNTVFNTGWVFYKKSKEHRYYGPASLFLYQFKIKSWRFKGKIYGSCGNNTNHYNQKQFLKDLKRQWLL